MQYAINFTNKNSKSSVINLDDGSESTSIFDNTKNAS